MPFPTADVPYDKDQRNPKLARDDHRPILVLDFDGVINSYKSGWQGAGTVPPDPPVPGTCEFIVAAVEHFSIHIHSSRSEFDPGRQAMRAYLMAAFQEYFHKQGDSEAIAWNKATSYVYTKLSFPEHKPPATITLDDRAITFTGEWPTIESLKNFKPWHKKEKQGE
jgi:hypothetical protein